MSLHAICQRMPTSTPIEVQILWTQTTWWIATGYQQTAILNMGCHWMPTTTRWGRSPSATIPKKTWWSNLNHCFPLFGWHKIKLGTIQYTVCLQTCCKIWNRHSNIMQLLICNMMRRTSDMIIWKIILQQEQKKDTTQRIIKLRQVLIVIVSVLTTEMGILMT